MKILIFLFLVLVILAACTPAHQKKTDSQVSEKHEWALVVHGGAGNLNPDDFTDEKEKAYREKLSEALSAGGKVLENNGSALDAVETAVRILEDSPLFNAGKGAVFNADGVNELDASIMDGLTLNAGAVANVTRIKNPISAARKVMENSSHVMLIKEGAEQFAAEQNIEMVDPGYFYTENRYKSLEQAKERENKNLEDKTKKSGTVGCVALDKNGNIAAGTSTGGMTNKKYGRVGDSPIIGAGTYADNNFCGVSATGHGEYFIRNVVAYDIAARMKYKGETAEFAANDVITNKLKAIDASGGVIVLDKSGNITMPFNTSGMFRGYLYPGDGPEIFIFQDNQENPNQ
ncbi:MAG: isoaspartyl peptidase/L-asparaginase [Bacteroidales bacterium]|nr:isoaspartyl peptidase/L-asparaginase [Bacteroidales bacterium]